MTITKKLAGVTLAFLLILFLIIPQFSGQVYAGLTYQEAKPGETYAVSTCCYEIKKGGTYTFTGETTKNYISVDTSEKVEIYLENVKIDTESGYEHPAISIQGSSDAVIYVKGTNYLQGGKRDHWLYTNDGYAGIRVTTDAKVTILGNGSLETHGGGGARGAAGIGGNYDNSCGRITIGDDDNAPTVIATGGGSGSGNDGAAGIGGGYDGQSNHGIIINNGTITATGGNGAAGIGGGQAYAAGSGGKVDGIEIHGGTVTATGGEDGAGIGSGEAGSSGAGGDATNIVITGGVIEAKGGDGGGAGIGGGDGGYVNDLHIGGTVEDALPEGSYVKAVGGTNGAGIGSSNGTVGFLYVSLRGGTVEAIGGTDAAGIGGGDGKAEDIYINGWGTIKAEGYDESAAIGAGHNEAGGNITIQGKYYPSSDSQKDTTHKDKSDYGLVINATNHYHSSDNDAAVIGGADSYGGNIKIDGAHITLSSKSDCEGAGIGAGANSSLNSGSMGSIEIKNCYIEDANGQNRYAPTIGVGREGDLEEIVIENCYIKGAGIGGSNNQAGFFQDPKISGISIRRSTVIADANTKAGTNRINARAAIGSGCYGAMGFIRIVDSTVDAKTEGGAGIGSGGYYADDSSAELNWQGGACGPITISSSNVTASGGDGGAGIGGGWGTSVDDITIEKSNVTATGSDVKYQYKDDNGDTLYWGAAGIGGGWAESCGSISISYSNVHASGCDYSAGIGSGGAPNKYAENWDASVKGPIEIWGSEVTANGGAGGAGIGAGEGATFDSDTYISIRGQSRINANGGTGGAGIGGGKSAYKDRGGESCAITIGLATDEYTEKPEDAETYVKAQGGAGAAGIGSGGVVDTSGDPNDANEITIESGYVYARGGDEGSIKAGSGAGIGGGNGGGKLNSLVVEGGIVEAHAGYASQRGAYDIGAGGNDDTRKDYKCKVKVHKGTVLGRISNDGGQTTVDGGSVENLVEGAKNSSGTSVYKTTMRIFTPYTNMSDYNAMSQQPGELPSELQVTSCNNYNTGCIFSDRNSRAYLWLPASEEDKATAVYKEKQQRNTVSYNYYGTTKNDGSGWMKMGGKLNFKLAEEPYVGEVFLLELDEKNISGKVAFHLQQTSPGEKCIEIVEQNDNLPGAWVKLLATESVSYTVTATTSDSEMESELYWSAEGTYSGNVAKEREYIVSVDDPSKVYDGKPVEDPKVDLKSLRQDADLSYLYYDKAGNYLGDDVRPVNVGTYFVKVRVGGDEQFESAETEMRLFTIDKRKITLGIEGSSSDEAADIKVYAENVVDNPGVVSLNLECNGQTTSATEDFVFDQESQMYVAHFHYDNGPEGEVYNITAVYDGSQNYLEATEDAVYSKNKKDRTVILNSLVHEYGFWYTDLLYGTLSEKDIPSDEYYYEIVSDPYQQLCGEETLRLSSNGATATVYYENAGKVLAKVTVKNPYYNDAVDYSTIDVAKAPLKVKSFAYDASDSSKRIQEIPYGSIDKNIAYDLEYEGLDPKDHPEDFAKGRLHPVPLRKDTQVGEHKIYIEKKGTEVTVDGKTRIVPFFSRNYDVELVPGTITIVPETLYINVNDITGKYGMTELAYNVSFGDESGNYTLMPWDTEDDVISSIGTKKAFGEYKPGVYKGEIIIEPIEKNYKFTDEKGMSTLHAGTLTVEKGDLAVDVSVPSYVYNGKAAEAEVRAKPITAEGVDAENLAKPSNPEIIYYEKTTAGEWTKLKKAPADAGIYKVEAVWAEDEYYEKASATAKFQISKARSDVEAPEVADVEYRDGLKLSDVELPDGWEWQNGEKELQVGPVSEYAVYTPKDTRNYYKAVRLVTFDVFEKKDTDDDGSDDDSSVTPITPGDEDGSGKDSNDSDSEGTAHTGDDTSSVMWLLILLQIGALYFILRELNRRKTS